MRSIIVTGIGGMVAQGVLKNILSLKLDVRIIGVNVTAVSAGNHMCDEVYVVPYAYEDHYIDRVREISEKENASLIIPTTDYESFSLAKHRGVINVDVATSSFETLEFCLDKYKTYLAFEKEGIPFAKSYLPSKYNGQEKSILVKPREGRGSRGIFRNPSDLKKFDDSFLIQPLLKGEEITTTFYVTKEKALHGIITFKRELAQGATSLAEVTKVHDEKLKSIIDKMVKKFGFQGSCNLQSIISNGEIVPFEVNCRISGTNSLRSQFGFSDVQYTIEEYYKKETLSVPKVLEGSAIRYMVDIIYPGLSLGDIKNKSDNHYIN